MKGFPKVIKTKSDLVNTFKLVQKKRLKKEDWLAAVEKLENQNWIMCPAATSAQNIIFTVFLSSDSSMTGHIIQF